MKKTKESTKENKFTFSFFISLILIVLIPNLLYSEGMDQQLEIRMLGLSALLAFLSAFYFINNKSLSINSNLKLFKNPYVLTYFSLTVFICISAFWATNKSEAIYEGLKRLSYLILFFYLIFIFFPKDNYKKIITRSFLILGIIITINGILQFLEITGKEGFNIDSIYKITGNYAQKNIFSEVLFITFAFSVIGIFYEEKTWKTIAIISSILNILLIVLLMTRAIWAGLIISGLITTILYFYFIKSKDKNKHKTLNFKLLYIIIAVVILSITSIFILDKNNTISKQIKSATNFEEGNTYHRLNLWNKSLILSKKYPVLGIGAANWRIEILQYDLQVFTGKGRIMPDRTHNDFIQILVEYGLIGFLLFIICLILLIYYSIFIIKHQENNKDKIFMLIILFALIGYNIDSLFAFPRERVELQIFINIIYAIIVYEYYQIKKQSIKTNKKQNTNLIISILTSCFLISSTTTYAAYKRMIAENGVKKIYTYNSSGNHEMIIKTIDEIYSPFFTITPFGDPLMDIKATSLFMVKKDKQEIFDTFDKSLKDSPYHLKTHQDLAIVYLNLKNYDKAMEYCKKGLKYAPNDAQTQVIIAKIHLSQNKIDSAYNVLRNINLTYDPNTNRDFNQILSYILHNKVSTMASLTKNQEFLINLDKINKNEEQLISIFKKSQKNNEAFEKTLLSILLPLCKKELIKNDASINLIKSKYN